MQASQVRTTKYFTSSSSNYDLTLFILPPSHPKKGILFALIFFAGNSKIRYLMNTKFIYLITCRWSKSSEMVYGDIGTEDSVFSSNMSHILPKFLQDKANKFNCCCFLFTVSTPQNVCSPATSFYSTELARSIVSNETLNQSTIERVRARAIGEIVSSEQSNPMSDVDDSTYSSNFDGL